METRKKYISGETSREMTSRDGEKLRVAAEIDRMLEQLNGAINPDFSVALVRQIRTTLDKNKEVLGSGAVREYDRRLNFALEEKKEAA
jgi:hypothetical protein